ncbi:MAG: hypothetical protein WBX11_17680 [Thiobacillaceae bacterium]
MAMTVEIKDNKLHIEIDLEKPDAIVLRQNPSRRQYAWECRYDGHGRRQASHYRAECLYQALKRESPARYENSAIAFTATDVFASSVLVDGDVKIHAMDSMREIFWRV